jgi:hypothetical protein
VAVEKLRNDDPFNPDYQKEKKFIRKDTVKKIIILSVFVLIFLYGSSDYMNRKIVDIEIRTVTGRKIDSVSFTDGRCDIFLINRSPYSIRLIIDDSIRTNYNNTVLEKDFQYYFWFESEVDSTLNIGGVKG